MGCGASTPRHREEEDDEPYEDEEPSPVKASSGSDKAPRLVTDINGHTAYVQVFDVPYYDLTVYAAARKQAQKAEAAAAAGALRPALKREDFQGSLEALTTQHRVLRLSLQPVPAAAADDGALGQRIVSARIAPS